MRSRCSPTSASTASPTFKVNQAKQFVACNPDGYVIGDAILFYLAPDKLSLVGRPSSINWVQYHIESGKYKATAERDERSFVNKGTRRFFRYQVQGPHALKVMEKVLGKPAPDIKFFNMSVITIAGHEVHALRHGMVGQPGWEIFGRWEHGEAVRDAIVQAGQEFGIRRVGARTYPTSCLESGWIPSPLPAVYTGNDMKPYREWLNGKSYEAMASLGGSFYSKDIRDYYLTRTTWATDRSSSSITSSSAGRRSRKWPAIRAARKSRWCGTARTSPGCSDRCSATGRSRKYIDLPLANYATLPYDKVLKGGQTVGVSTYTGYTYNERAIVSLAIVNVEHSEPGTQVSVVWGEEGGGSSKPTVERHVQVEIRATVAPVPISDVARVGYRPK